MIEGWSKSSSLRITLGSGRPVAYWLYTPTAKTTPTNPARNARVTRMMGIAMRMRRTVFDPPDAWGRRWIVRRCRWRRARLVCIYDRDDSITWWEIRFGPPGSRRPRRPACDGGARLGRPGAGRAAPGARVARHPPGDDAGLPDRLASGRRI